MLCEGLPRRQPEQRFFARNGGAPCRRTVLRDCFLQTLQLEVAKTLRSLCNWPYELGDTRSPSVTTSAKKSHSADRGPRLAASNRGTRLDAISWLVFVGQS